MPQALRRVGVGGRGPRSLPQLVAVDRSFRPGHQSTTHTLHTTSVSASMAPQRTSMAPQRKASLSGTSASTSMMDMGTSTIKGTSFSKAPTAASSKHAFTASKAAVAAAAPVSPLPADVEDEQKGEILAGTHYILEGPASGKLVVCVPGLGGPHWYFDEIAPFLLQAGFRVLRYDLVGRGHSKPASRTRRPSCFCNGVAREKDPYGRFNCRLH